MTTHAPTAAKLIFLPVNLDEDDPRCLTWSVNVDLPTAIENEISAYTKQDEYSVWTVILHEALYVYRRQFWTEEQLKAEFEQEIEERIANSETEGGIEVTPAFWKSLMKRSKRRVKDIKKLQAEGELGNLLLPKELYAFILERIEAGTAITPTDVACSAMPFLRRARRDQTRHLSKSKRKTRTNKAKVS